MNALFVLRLCVSIGDMGGRKMDLSNEVVHTLAGVPMERGDVQLRD